MTDALDLIISCYDSEDDPVDSTYGEEINCNEKESCVKVHNADDGIVNICHEKRSENGHRITVSDDDCFIDIQRPKKFTRRIAQQVFNKQMKDPTEGVPTSKLIGNLIESIGGYTDDSEFADYLKRGIEYMNKHFAYIEKENVIVYDELRGDWNRCERFSIPKFKAMMLPKYEIADAWITSPNKRCYYSLEEFEVITTQTMQTTALSSTSNILVDFLESGLWNSTIITMFI